MFNMDDFVLQFQSCKLKEVEYDPEYTSKYTVVKKIMKRGWPCLRGGVLLGLPPSWVGFGKNKSYELMPSNRTESGIGNDFSGLRIIKIEKINNPYLERAYELKKLKSRIYTEKILYHATTPEKVDSICTNNFNWRLNGTSRGHKHGKGVSFSPHPGFANMFCKSLFEKRIIITKIVCSKSHVGMPHHDLPDPGYDTTTSPNGNVSVKFEDSEFLPTYVVHYI